MDKSRAVYGIDLGTTYSCIAQVDQFDQAIVLRNFEGDATTPSVVYFEDENNVLVGKDAKAMLETEPEKAVSFIKREMGNDAAFDKSLNTTPYHLDPSEISALILKKLVKDANDANGFPEPIKDVVITCPAYFGNKERMQTKQAGIIAGLNVLSIINEPTAAAIAYGTKVDERKTILVYDLGGGTFDVTIILVNKGAIKVIATGGDHHLGGVDWDTELASYMLDAFNSANDTNFSFDGDTMLKNTLLNMAENKKKLLTGKNKVNVNINWEGKSARFEITRELFDSLTISKLNETIDATNSILEIARKKGFEKIDEFLLVGGSSRMPQVKARIDQEYGVDARIGDVDEVVAKGAAIYAMNEAYSQAVQEYEEGDRDDRPAPIRGDRARVMNVTSKTYGLGLVENKVGNMIFANTSLPFSFQREFCTAYENQHVLTLPIWESDFTNPETDSTVEDKFCRLVTSEPAKLLLNKDWPKGSPVHVTFNIDNEGMLSVHAQVEHDDIDFQLKVTGVKSEEELLTSQTLLASMNIEYFVVVQKKRGY